MEQEWQLYKSENNSMHYIKGENIFSPLKYNPLSI